jgi:hypothetical protein
VTPVSKKVTDLDPEPSTTIPVQNILCKAVVPSSFNWRTEPVDYFHLFDLDLLALILQKTILNGNKKKMQKHAPLPKEKGSQADHLQP